jgi:hypothetical protein
MDDKLTNIALAKYIKVEEVEKETTKGWVEWGEGNAMPQYLIDLYQSSPVHGSLVNSISFMIAGKGFKSENPASQVNIAKLELDNILGSSALDLKLQGGVYWELIYSMDHTRIVQVNHLPYENVRLAISDEEDHVCGVWYSRDWQDIRKQKNKPEYVPLFNPEDQSPRQVLFFHLHSVGSLYYPRPDYISSKDWIELTRHISEYHVNNILNGFFPSFHINFPNGEPSPEAQRLISREIERNLSGTQNAGKFLITFTKGKDEAPVIQPFPVTDADKQYEYLSKEATSQIIVAHRVTSPLLMGVRTDGNGLGSNTDEIKAALYVFTKQVIEPFQRIITDAVEQILAFNGVPSQVTIEKNDIIEIAQEQGALPSDTTAAAPIDVASQALNGAQIASLLEIIVQTTANVLTVPSAKAITTASFPMLSQEQINSIFDNLSTTPINPATVLSALKKKVLAAEEEENSFAPTKEMAAEAELGLKWREEYKRGGTEVGVARARDISNMRNLSLDTVARMNSYFARHEVDKEALGWNQGEEGFPTAGRIAWQLWGGDPGKDWAARILERANSQSCAGGWNDFSDEQGAAFIEQLKAKAEYINDEWELLSDEKVTDALAEEDFVLQCQSLDSYAKGDESERSQWGDAGLYKLRYAYSQNLSANSRDFCIEMVAMSKAGAVFKYEDIQQMSDDGVNGEFAPAGQSEYDIFRWVGGAYCHHFWKRQIYFRKQEKGKFLPNKGLENDKRVGNVPYVKPKGIEGIAPINRPGRGSLKYG